MRLFEELERRRYLALAGIGLASIVLVWILLTTTHSVPQIFLPGPAEVIRQLSSGPTVSEWLVDLLYSCGRVFSGFFLAAIFGIPIGLYIGTVARFEALASPLVEMARYIPVPALIPLCILWFGVGELEKIIVIFLGTFFQLIVAVGAAARSSPREYVDVARTLGLHEQFILWRVVLPATWPSILHILQISLGWAWSYLVVAEIVAAGSGIGYRIMWSQRYLRVGLVFVGIIELAILALITDLGFRMIRKRFLRWVF